MKVNYNGILPDLFREGQGVVVLGKLQPGGTFRASEVLAKHDENYMPKEVADALKKSGHWNPAAGPPPPASTWDAMTVKHAGGKPPGETHGRQDQAAPATAARSAWHESGWRDRHAVAP